MDLGNNVLNSLVPDNVSKPHGDVTHGGGNSGAVISPAPGLGLSAYQNPKVPAGKLPTHQGE